MKIVDMKYSRSDELFAVTDDGKEISENDIFGKIKIGSKIYKGAVDDFYYLLNEAKYEYFISFMANGTSFGNATCGLDNEIKSIEDYQNFNEKFLEQCHENGYKSVVVLNFILLN